MKKRNLLTLTALCLSLGLTVTACQGPQGAAGKDGTNGKDGKDGVDGKDGKDGKDGVDGKTYQAIINLNNVTGGTISQDKYFVQPGESFTLTFEPDEGYDILLTLEINGEEVEVDPEATSKTFTSTEADMGWQITKAVFSSVGEYEKEGVIEYYNDLAEDDLGLGAVSLNDKTSKYEVADGVGDYADASKVVGTEAITQYENVKKAVSSLGTSATTKEKLAAADIAIAAAKVAINEKYAELVKTTKEKAEKDYEVLVTTYANGTNVSDYIDDDAEESILEDGKEAIESCTTLNEINAVVAKSYKASASAKSNSVGAYRQLLTDQETVLGKINTSLSTYTKDSTLAPTKDTDKLKKQAALVDAIEDLGVSVDKLPSEIAESYAEEVLASRSLEKDSKGDFVLATEADADLKASIKNLKEDLYDAVLKEYTDEVNALTSINAEQKQDLRVKLANAASNWKTGTKVTGTGSAGSTALASTVIEKYIGFKWDGTNKKGTISYDADTLPGALEKVLNEDASSSVKVERLNAVLNEFKAEWTAKVAEIKAADPTYAKALTYSATQADSKKALPTSQTLGESDWKIANFVFDTSSSSYYKDGKFVEQSLDDGATVATVARNASATTGNDIDSNKVNYYNIDTILYNLTESTEVNSTASYVSINSTATVADAKTWGAKFSKVFDTAHTAFLKEYARQAKSLVSTAYVGTSGSTYTPSVYSKSSLESAFEAKIYDKKNNLIVSTTDEITKVTKTSYENVAAIKAFDKGLGEFLKSVKDAGDTSFFNSEGTLDSDAAKYLVKDSVSTFYAKVLSSDESSILSKVLNGSYTEKQAKEAVSDEALTALYKEDTANYVASVLEILDKAVTNYGNSGSVSPNKLREMQALLVAVKGICKDGSFVYSSATTLNELMDKLSLTSSTKSATYSIKLADELQSWVSSEINKLAGVKTSDESKK